MRWAARQNSAVSCSMSRSAYHRWASGKLGQRTRDNEELAKKIEQIHSSSPDKGYRRINDDLRHDHGIYVNDKRVLRICRARDIKSTIKYASHSCTRRAKDPQYADDEEERRGKLSLHIRELS